MTPQSSLIKEKSIAGMGLLSSFSARGDLRHAGRPGHLTVKGMLMHSSMAFTLDGLPLGLTAIKFWTRDKFKGSDELKRHINPTRVPVEEKESFCWLENLRQSTRLPNDPGRCVHIGDRGSDIFELFCAAADEKTHFLFRTCVDRYAGERGLTIAKEMETPDGRGMHTLQLKTSDGGLSEARVEISYRRMLILPPEGKKKRYPALELTVIHAMETGKPEGRDPVKWKLLTDLPVASLKEALEKMNWYTLRWKIEVFHKILKSGCKAEDSLLRSSERLVKLISVFCIVSWRIFWMTMLNRAAPDAPPDIALTEDECRTLDALTNHDPPQDPGSRGMSHYLTVIARLGGYLARRRDPPPGNMVMWRGLRRLTDIMLGVQIKKLVGNWKELYAAYGDLLLRMGDTREAGRFLFLAGRNQDPYAEAVEVYLARLKAADKNAFYSTFPARARLARLSDYPQPVAEELKRRGFDEIIRYSPDDPLPAVKSFPGKIKTGLLVTLILTVLLFFGIGVIRLIGWGGQTVYEWIRK